MMSLHPSLSVASSEDTADFSLSDLGINTEPSDKQQSKKKSTKLKNGLGKAKWEGMDRKFGRKEIVLKVKWLLVV